MAFYLWCRANLGVRGAAGAVSSRRCSNADPDPGRVENQHDEKPADSGKDDGTSQLRFPATTGLAVDYLKDGSCRVSCNGWSNAVPNAHRIGAGAIVALGNCWCVACAEAEFGAELLSDFFNDQSSRESQTDARVMQQSWARFHGDVA